MDVLAHVLWTNAVFHAKYDKLRKQRYLAAFFGVAPDLVSFIPATIYTLLNSKKILNFIEGKDLTKISPEHYNALNSWVFDYAIQSYNYTHSLVIFAAVFLVVLAVRKGKFYWPLLGWGLHILIDMFTHKDFFETPFLFPISNVTNHNAIVWGEPIFMVINYGLLILVYAGLFWYHRKRIAKV